MNLLDFRYDKYTTTGNDGIIEKIFNILYIDPVVHSPISEKYKYYDGIFDSLDEAFLYRGVPTDLQVLIDGIDFVPDAVVFGLGWFNHKSYKKIENINIPSVCMLFKPQNSLDEKLNFCTNNNIDVILTPIPQYKKYEEKTGIRTILFPYGFDPKVFANRKIKKEYDIGFSGALHQSSLYPDGSFRTVNIRKEIGIILSSIPLARVFWRSSDNAATAYIDDIGEYADTIGKSRMWIATQAAYGDITPRFYEVLASGALLLCPGIPEEYSHLLVHGHNCVEFSDDLSDLEEKIRYYVANPDEAEKISSAAANYFRDNHTWNHRANMLYNILGEI